MLDVRPGPIVALNHVVTLAMVAGARAGLDRLDHLEASTQITTGRRPLAVRARLLELDGDLEAARRTYLDAARQTANSAQQRYLRESAARLEHR